MSNHDLWFEILKKEDVINVWGYEIRLLDFHTSKANIFLQRDFEQDDHKARELTFNDGDVIVDCGANIGLFSILMGKKFPKTRIYAIECMPHNVRNLKINLEQNKVTNVIIVDGAIAGSARKLTIAQHPLNSGSASQFMNVDFYPKFEVQSMTLDTLVDWIEEPIAFMKMDIEGSEHETLAAFTKWDRIKHMTIELHDLSNATKEVSNETVTKTKMLLEEKLKGKSTIVYL